MRAGLVILGGLCGLWAGCVVPASPQDLTAASIWVQDADAFERQWGTTLRVLRRHGFVPDRQDTRAGVITTAPLTGGQVWEFWRRDCYHPYYQAEHDLHTIRRTARVELERRGQLGECQLRVFVEVERLSRPERAVILASGAVAAFGSDAPTTAGRLPPAEGEEHWVPLGRDGVLERRLLNEMTRGRREVALGLEPPPTPPPVPAQPQPNETPLDQPILEDQRQ